MADIAEPAVPGPLAVLARLPARNMLALMVGAAALLAVLIGAALWVRAPDYRPLYGALAERDGGAVIGALTQLNIPFRYADGGAILVPADKVHDARLKLAAQGLPRGGSAGFELIENPKFGMSQFQEQVSYQRALEGELARTIQSLSAVQSARVHLALPKQSVFLRDQQKPSASVVLTVHNGKSLEREQITGIVHLVASSVPDLPPRNVSVVDQNGTLLSQALGSGDGRSLDPSQLAFVARIESSFIRRIEDILEPIVGRANVRAQVTADVDFSVDESTAETYRPNQNGAEATVRSQQVSESSAPREGAAAGIPGAASNAPQAPAAGAGPTPPAASTSAAGGAPASTRREALTNYEVDKTVRVVRNPVGSLKRLSVAVVVNHRRTVGADGKATYTALSEPELAQITALVKEAVGLSEKRGDTLNVAHAAFAQAVPEPVVEPAVWQRLAQDPELASTARELGKGLLFVVVALVIVFAAVRPALRQLAASVAAARAGSRVNVVEDSVPPLTLEGRVEAARILARQDPKAVANVVHRWVTRNE